MLTLAEIAENPSCLTRRLKPPSGPEITLRPLKHTDTVCLADFLDGLSPETRRFIAFDGQGLATARDLCDAIARYDKLRLVLEDLPSARIIGLLEFSLALTPADLTRYQDAGIRLSEPTDCRFGATLADGIQGRGIGTLAFPFVSETARLLGKARIILWGGVRADNPRAIRYYEKNGFQPVGSFTPAEGSRSFDMILDLSDPTALSNRIPRP
ncbi:GNAT family N-acetyltransferase [Streptomyces sp. NPDC102406]|uniref:GNAT family N-acetyltransferase n=1 Tax=Streptomyces sp. NPDC102406 TaxID=3366171 RepID=UPI003808992E